MVRNTITCSNMLEQAARCSGKESARPAPSETSMFHTDTLIQTQLPPMHRFYQGRPRLGAFADHLPLYRSDPSLRTILALMFQIPSTPQLSTYHPHTAFPTLLEQISAGTEVI